MNDIFIISDFDGSLTFKDFYWIIIDEYLGDVGREYFKRWKNEELLDIEFLNYIFKNIGKTEEEIDEIINSIPFDDSSIPLMNLFKDKFIVLSAGTSYYIKKIFEKHGIKDIKIISNDGIYKNKGIEIIPDCSNEFYSKRYGVDKRKVVESFKKPGRTLVYIGDSEPDYLASKECEIIFARGSLKELLDKEKRENFYYESFKDVYGKLKCKLKG